MASVVPFNFIAKLPVASGNVALAALMAEAGRGAAKTGRRSVSLPSAVSVTHPEASPSQLRVTFVCCVARLGSRRWRIAAAVASMRIGNATLLFGGDAIESGTVNVTPGCVTAGSNATLYVVIVPEPLFRMTPSRDTVNVPTTSGAPKEMPAMPRLLCAVDRNASLVRAALATSIRPAPTRLTA